VLGIDAVSLSLTQGVRPNTSQAEWMGLHLFSNSNQVIKNENSTHIGYMLLMQSIITSCLTRYDGASPPKGMAGFRTIDFKNDRMIF
jgi:hypothetical protein